MIEKIHRYSGLLMVVLVISAIAFIFGDFNRGSHGYNTGRPMMKISGRTYNEKEFGGLGKSSLGLATSIAQGGDFSIYQFVFALSSGGNSESEQVEKFFTGRMLIRDAKDEFGVHPGEEEISAYLRNLKMFSGPEGKFNAPYYQNFIQRALGPQGMTEKDLRELASDVLAFEKIKSIVGSGLLADRAAVAENLALENQQVTGGLAKLELAPFQEKVQPTEEEIKAYWENFKDSFTTEPRRKFSYIVLTPPSVADAEVPDEPETIAEAAASDEAKKAAAKKKDEARASRAAAAAEARQKNQLELDTKLDDFLYTLGEQKGSGFEELAKANGWELKTTDFFSRANAPKELDLPLRPAASGGNSADQLFKIIETSDPFSKFSTAIAVGENQWIIARLDGEEKSRPKTFEEARNEARAQYISEKASENLKTAATEAIAKIKTSIAAGKSFAEAATEAGVPEASEFVKINSTTRPDGATQPQNLFQAVRNIDPGTLAEPIVESDRAFILFVSKREVVKEPNAATRIDTELVSSTNENAIRAFGSWLTARTEDAKVETLYNR